MATTKKDGCWDGGNIRMINGKEVKTHSVCITGSDCCSFVEVGSTGCTGEEVREKSGRSFLQMDFRNGDFWVEPVYDGDRCTGVTLVCCGDEEVCLLNGVMTFVREMMLFGRVRSREEWLKEAVFLEDRGRERK